MLAMHGGTTYEPWEPRHRWVRCPQEMAFYALIRADQGRMGALFPLASAGRCGKSLGNSQALGKVWPKYGNMVDIFVKVHGWVLAMGHFSDFFHPRKTFQFCCEKRP